MHINCAPNRNRWKLRLAGLVASLMATVSAFAVTNIALDNNTAPPAGITALVAENSGGAPCADLTGQLVVADNSFKSSGAFDSGQVFQNGGGTGVCPMATDVTNYVAKKNSGTIALADNQIAAFDQAVYHLIAGPAPNIAGNVANANDPNTATIIGQKIEVPVLTAGTVNNANANNTDAAWTTPNSNLGGAFASAYTGDLPNFATRVNSFDLADTLATHTGTAPPATVRV